MEALEFMKYTAQPIWHHKLNQGKEQIFIMDRGLFTDASALSEYNDNPDAAIVYPDNSNIRDMHKELIGSMLCKIYYQTLTNFVTMLHLNDYKWKIIVDLKDCNDSNEMESVMMRLCGTESSDIICESKSDTFENQYRKIINHIKLYFSSESKDGSPIGPRIMECGSGPLIHYDEANINKMTWILPWDTWKLDDYARQYSIILSREDS